MNKQVIGVAAISGAFAVILGAFGAHALENTLLSYGTVDTYETASQYHFYHTLVLLALGLFFEKIDRARTIFWFFLMGMLIFSGTLYTLSITNVKILGAITPIGGFALILGWILLAASLLRKRNT